MKENRSFWQKDFKNLNDEFSEFFQNSWPINWSNFSKPKLLVKSVLIAPYHIKILLSAFALVLLISLGFLISGSYFLLTREVASSGGEFREVVLNDRIERFNPVLEATSETEKKITSLLFHPLYQVEFPNFLENNQNQPVIKPVLLAEAPVWANSDQSPANQYRVLRMKLKPDLKWSNGDKITVSDLIYSFERIKEERGNRDFQEVFRNYELVAAVGSELEFEIRPNKPGIGPNPQLIYLANFSPVSEKFFKSVRNADLYTSIKSLQPTVSSGYFVFPEKVQDPDNSSRQLVDNPIRKNVQGYSTVVLQKNPIHQRKDSVFLDTYILKIVDRIEESGGSTVNSLEREAKNKKVDLFTRFLGPAMSITSQELKNLTSLEQVLIPTNTYFSLYLNIQASGGGLEGYLINKSLRKYILCNLFELNLDPQTLAHIKQIPPEKRLLPLHFAQEYTPNCSDATAELLSQTNSRGSGIYKIDTDERSGIKRLKVFDREPSLNLLALEEFAPYAEIIQNKLQEMGLVVNVTWANTGTLETSLAQKNYHMTLLPITMVNRNLYPIYGLTGKNLSNISRNERVNGRAVEQQLQQYTESNLEDESSKTQLLEFFKNEFVSLNLFQVLQEINYSSRVTNLSFYIPPHLTFTTDQYHNVNRLYTNTKRRLK